MEHQGSEYYAVGYKNTVFWNVMPCIPVQVHLHFRGTNCLHLQGRRISQASNQKEAGGSTYLVLFASCLAFDLEHGGSILLRNVDELSDYTESHPRRQYSS
jgi:hypothetical protein